MTKARLGLMLLN